MDSDDVGHVSYDTVFDHRLPVCIHVAVVSVLPTASFDGHPSSSAGPCFHSHCS